MSGLAGTYHIDGRSASAEQVASMAARLRHRGPDASGIWAEGPVGLGHVMLWTTPESLQEKLPYRDASSELAITSDARIDNREELLRLLGLEHGTAAYPSGSDVPDSVLILAAYERWGEDCPSRLLGDFAFVIWDARRQTLFCARDVMGIKPFYYHRSERLFACASEIGGLLALEEIPRRLNERKVGDFLVPVFDELEETFYEGILRLPPAHSLVVTERGEVRSRRYWSLDPESELRLESDEAYVEAFREVFTEAVRCRMRSAYPVGSTLSGGLDSSAITCTAERLLAEEAPADKKLHTFSAVFPDVAVQAPRTNERPYMDSVLATSDRFEAHFIDAGQVSPLDYAPLNTDEPLSHPNFYMTFSLFEAGRREGVRVLLSGFEGDSTIGYGLESLSGLAESGKWNDFGREARAIFQREKHRGASSYLRHYGFPHLTQLAKEHNWLSFSREAMRAARGCNIAPRKIFWEAGLRPAFFNGNRRQAEAGPLSELNGAIDAAFAGRIDLPGRTQKQQLPHGSAAFRAKHIHELMSGFLLHIGERYDQVSAANSLEQRYPFFDRRLMEFCVALPLDQRLRDGRTRLILRRGMEGIIPEAIQERYDKGQMGANTRRIVARDRQRLDGIVSNGDDRLGEFVDRNRLREAYERFVSEPQRSSEKDLFTVFLAANLSLWLQGSQADNPQPAADAPGALADTVASY